MKDNSWLRTYLLLLIAFWTAVIAASFWYNRNNIYQNTLDSALLQARTAYEKDLVYRRWNAINSVYAVSSAMLPPNPHLSSNNRDIEYEGMLLTRVNPAYMARLVHDMGALSNGTLGKITSLEPIRPENRPDEWKTSALQALAADPDLREVSEVRKIDDREYMSFMGGLTTEPSCLGCHQDYKVGELRGGIAVEVPMTPFLNTAREAMTGQIVSHSALWLLGALVFFSGAGSIARREKERNRVKQALQELTEDLEARVAARTEEEQAREMQLQAFMDNTDAAVFIKNARHEFLMVNKRLADMLKARPEELIGKASGNFINQKMTRLMEDYEERALVTRTGREVRLFNEPDSPFPPHSAFFFPIIGPGGSEPTGVGCIMVDITRHKRIEEALRDAKEAAEKASRAKNDFLANVSHEIRTPLNGVIGMADLLLHTSLSVDQASMAAIIKSSGDSLLSVLNDVLDFSKIEASRMRLESIPFSLRDTIFDTVRNMAPSAAQKKNELLVNVAASIPDNLQGDPQRLRQILLNLLSNAIKFTANGEISITAQLLERLSGQARLRLSITDSGIGIPREKQNQIFAAFEQADTSTTRKYGGTGLGLTICSKLAALMGSELRLESQPGYGSTFWMDVAFPVLEEGAVRKPLVSSEALSGLNALVVDDNPASQRVSLEQLRSWGMHVATCSGADEARRLLRMASNSKDPFDVIISDLQMPEKDGVDLALDLQADPAFRDTPVILLSYGDLPEKPAMPKFSAVLSKPVRPEELVRAISSAAGLWESVNLSQFGENAPAGSMPRSSVSLDVLLVEDMEMNQIVAERMLQNLGHNVTLAANGQEALNLLAGHAFDLVFMDMQMPVLDGERATRRIRELEAASERHTVIVAMTAHAMLSDRDKYLTAGVDGYLAKPIRTIDMVKIIEDMVKKFGIAGKLHGKTQSAAGEESAESERSAPPYSHARPVGYEADLYSGGAGGFEGLVTQFGPGKSYLDQSVMKSSFSDMQDLIVQSMEIYINDSAELLEKIAAALAVGSNPTLAAEAHSLKGLTGYYTRGLPYENALTLELAGRNALLPEADARLRQVFEELKLQVRDMREEMKAYIGRLKAGDHSLEADFSN